MSILHKVVSHGRVHQLRLLLKMGTSLRVNMRDETNKTALILCALIDDEKLGLKLLNILLEDPRTDHDAVDMFNRNVLTYAIIKGRYYMLQTLLENRATISMNMVDTDGLSNLHHAVKNGEPTILSMMVSIFKELCLNMDPKSNDGLTPLMLAIKLEKFDCANILLLEGNASYAGHEPVLQRNCKDWVDIKYKMFKRKREDQIIHHDLISRSRTEERITMRRRGAPPVPRSALTAPTTGLPFLTTRASKRRDNPETYQFNELKRLKFYLDSKIKPTYGKKEDEHVGGSFEVIRKKTCHQFSESTPRYHSNSNSMSSIYHLLSQQLWVEEQTQKPLLPTDCPLLAAHNTRFSSANTHSSLSIL